MIRVLALAAGLFGGVGLSQFPEYSQQYTQRLSGAVDELNRIVVMFDADASSLGMTRQQALADLAQGGRMGAARAQSMGQVLERHARLSADLASLKTSGTAGKILNISSFKDREVARKTLADFKPAIPVSPEGLGLGGVGFGLGYSAVVILTALLGRLWRRWQRLVPEA